jgi:anti-sigma B factor antagonist
MGTDIEVFAKNDLTVVKPQKEIRVRTILALRTIFEEIETRKGGRVAVDLADVSYIDSSGIGLLLNFSKRLKACGGKLYLYNPSDDIKAILYIAEMDEVVPFFENFDDLRDAITNGRA